MPINLDAQRKSIACLPGAIGQVFRRKVSEATIAIVLPSPASYAMLLLVDWSGRRRLQTGLTMVRNLGGDTGGPERLCAVTMFRRGKGYSSIVPQGPRAAFETAGADNV